MLLITQYGGFSLVSYCDSLNVLFRYPFPYQVHEGWDCPFKANKSFSLNDPLIKVSKKSYNVEL